MNNLVRLEFEELEIVGDEIMDYQNVVINGVVAIPFVIGWVGFAKEMGLQSAKGLRLLAVVLGVIAFTVPELAKMYPVIEPWINLAFYGLGGGLAAGGLYDTAKEIVQGKKLS